LKARLDAVGAALAAGVAADAVNTAMLWGFDALGVSTAHGGLLRLLLRSADAVLATVGTGTLPPPTPAVQVAFHAAVGLAMALGYAGLVEPRLPGPPWCRALATALAAWLVNAALVLPATGEGFAGSRHLGSFGLAAFGLAHTAFFLVLAESYARLGPAHRSREVMGPRRGGSTG
jgi:hypothetical protein